MCGTTSGLLVLGCIRKQLEQVTASALALPPGSCPDFAPPWIVPRKMDKPLHLHILVMMFSTLEHAVPLRAAACRKQSQCVLWLRGAQASMCTKGQQMREEHLLGKSNWIECSERKPAGFSLRAHCPLIHRLRSAPTHHLPSLQGKLRLGGCG